MASNYPIILRPLLVKINPDIKDTKFDHQLNRARSEYLDTKFNELVNIEPDKSKYIRDKLTFKEINKDELSDDYKEIVEKFDIKEGNIIELQEFGKQNDPGHKFEKFDKHLSQTLITLLKNYLQDLTEPCNEPQNLSEMFKQDFGVVLRKSFNKNHQLIFVQYLPKALFALVRKITMAFVKKFRKGKNLIFYLIFEENQNQYIKIKEIIVALSGFGKSDLQQFAHDKFNSQFWEEFDIIFPSREFQLVPLKPQEEASKDRMNEQVNLQKKEIDNCMKLDTFREILFIRQYELDNIFSNDNLVKIKNSLYEYKISLDNIKDCLNEIKSLVKHITDLIKTKELIFENLSFTFMYFFNEDTIRSIYDIYWSWCNINDILYDKNQFTIYSNDLMHKKFKTLYFENYNHDQLDNHKQVFDTLYFAYTKIEDNNKNIMQKLARCSEDNLIDYIAENKQIIHELGIHVYFSVEIDGKIDQAKQIETRSPCNICMYRFVAKFGKILRQNEIELNEQVDYVSHNKISTILYGKDSKINTGSIVLDYFQDDQDGFYISIDITQLDEEEVENQLGHDQLKELALEEVETSKIIIDDLGLISDEERKINFYRLDNKKHSRFIEYLKECASKNMENDTLYKNFEELKKPTE